jgi:putative FmdB family regulatory protein
MPIYEYLCETCEHTFERLTFKGEDEHVTCPECGSKKIKKIPSAACFMGDSGHGACKPNASSGFS